MGAQNRLYSMHLDEAGSRHGAAEELLWWRKLGKTNALES